MALAVCLLCIFSLVLPYTTAGEFKCEDVDSITEDVFCYIENKIPVKRYTWTNKDNFQIQIINYGARITVMKIPDRNGVSEDIALGFDNCEGYFGDNPYFGAIQGRVGNRIGGANFTLNGKVYFLPANEPGRHNTLSGGFKGYDKVLWEPYVSGNKLILSHLSVDGDNGFPGTVLAQVTYEFSKNKLCFTIRAWTTKPTPLNLINHSHYNLAGQSAGPEALLQHLVSINADKYTELTPDELPTGKLIPVHGTPFDLTGTVKLADTTDKLEGYDHNFCINEQEEGKMHLMGRIEHPESGRGLLMHSTQPGGQFYTGIHLPLPGSAQAIFGKGGFEYIRGAGLFLEPQHYPDAVHHPNFPSIIVNPNKEYNTKTCFSFYTTI